MITSPPLPPSPPEGPPRGTYFSRRKAMHPLPPSPALTRIFASSMNISLPQPPQAHPLGSLRPGPAGVLRRNNLAFDNPKSARSCLHRHQPMMFTEADLSIRDGCDPKNESHT